MKTRFVQREFNKERSVFKDWRKDDPDFTYRSCIEHDLALWHVDKFVKDPDEAKETADVLRKYAKEIKNIFIQLISKSSYPQIGVNDFTAFSNKIEFPD